MSNVQLADYSSPQDRKVFDLRKEFRKPILATSEVMKRNPSIEEFYEVCKKARDYVFKIYDKKVESGKEDSKEYVNLYHRAMLGHANEVNMIKQQIKEFINLNALFDIYCPEYYENLIDGIFEEEYGWGPLSAWKRETDSEGAQVIGTDIKFKTPKGWILQPFSFRNIEQAKEVYARLANVDSQNKLDEHTNTELYTSTHDGYRVSIMIPKRTFEEPVITMRNQTIKTHSFAVLEKYHTIPEGTATLLTHLSRMFLNNLVVGPPGCGKSTLLMTMLGTVLYREKDGKQVPESYNTLFAESSPEWAIRKLFPHSNVLHVIGEGEDFEKVISEAMLRHDITRVVTSEIRQYETGLYHRGALQGIKQVMGTLHDLHPQDVPGILTNLYLQYHKVNLNPDNVYKTFAENLHYSISMDEVDIDKKRVTGIQFYDVDKSLSVKVYKILHYDYLTDTWSFYNDIPKRITEMMKKNHYAEFNNFKALLDELTSLSQIDPEHRFIETTYGRDVDVK